jgi:hypothetical protein
VNHAAFAAYSSGTTMRCYFRTERIFAPHFNAVEERAEGHNEAAKLMMVEMRTKHLLD